jgi:hypothetical protein
MTNNIWRCLTSLLTVQPSGRWLQRKSSANERELSKISWVFLLGSLAERFGEFILDRFDRLTNYFLCLGS